MHSLSSESSVPADLIVSLFCRLSRLSRVPPTRLHALQEAKSLRSHLNQSFISCVIKFFLSVVSETILHGYLCSLFNFKLDYSSEKRGEVTVLTSQENL